MMSTRYLQSLLTVVSLTATLTACAPDTAVTGPLYEPDVQSDVSTVDVKADVQQLTLDCVPSPSPEAL